jgi:parallel beta-helix repeat protein
LKLVNLLMIVLLLPINFDCSYDSLSIHSASLATTATVVVTNTTDTVNGDTSSINTLVANPGTDGISFREAIRAANNTLGLKAIEFAPNLKGATIYLGAGGITNEPIILTSGQLTINGDIDGDDKPDITLDGSLDTTGGPISAGLKIWSSNNIIENMNLVEFNAGAGIACPVPEPLQKVIASNQIVGNIISSTHPGSFGIMLSAMGLISQSDAYKASDLLIKDTLIARNTTSVQSIGIGIIAGSGGASRDQFINITVMNNHIMGESGIGIGAGDTASDSYGVPGTIQYSDNNLVDHVVIVENIIEGSGISVGAANLGNRYNRVQHVQIANNTIRRAVFGIILVASGNSGNERTTSFNSMSDIEVNHNTIADVLWYGILVGVGDAIDHPDNPMAAGIDNNQLSRLQITDNDIENYHAAGLKVRGGCGYRGNLNSSNNLLDQLIITGNRIIHFDPNDRAVGIELLGGEGFGGPAQGNIIQGAIISSNTVSGNDIGISLVGGRGTGVQGNHVVMAEMQANDLAGNTKPMQIIDNTQGAVGNSVDLPYKIYLPLVEHE